MTTLLHGDPSLPRKPGRGGSRHRPSAAADV